MRSLAVAKKLTPPVPHGSLAHGSLWISTTELATVGSITSRKAREAAFRCFNGATWRGCTLQVRSVEGVGGKGGKALQVYVPSLPADLRAIWDKRNPGALATPAVAPLQLPGPAIIDLRIGDRVAEMKWKLAIVAPALLQPKGSAARAAILANIAARTHQGLNGKPVQIAVDTLRDWLVKIEAGNEARLARQRRSDAGKVRHYINGKWDKACPLAASYGRGIQIKRAA